MCERRKWMNGMVTRSLSPKRPLTKPGAGADTSAQLLPVVDLRLICLCVSSVMDLLAAVIIFWLGVGMFEGVSKGDPFQPCSLISSRSTGKVLYRPTLGRPTSLGMLYSAHSDNLIQGFSLWEESEIRKVVKIQELNNLQPFTVVFSNCFWNLNFERNIP